MLFLHYIYALLFSYITSLRQFNISGVSAIKKGGVCTSALKKYTVPIGGKAPLKMIVGRPLVDSIGPVNFWRRQYMSGWTGGKHLQLVKSTCFIYCCYWFESDGSSHYKVRH